MLGQPLSMLLPPVVGLRLHGEMAEGTTATDLVLTITELLRRHGVVGKFVEAYGPGLATVPVEIARPSATCRPSTAPPAPSSPSMPTPSGTWSSPDARTTNSLWSRRTPRSRAYGMTRRRTWRSPS